MLALLTAQPRLSSEVWAELLAQGFKYSTIKRTKAALGLRSSAIGWQGKRYLWLPATCSGPAPGGEDTTPPSPTEPDRSV